MTWLSDSSLLISSHWVSSAYAGHGITGAALRSSTGTGGTGAGILYNDWDTGDDASEFRYVILSYPSAGTLTPNEDGSFTFIGAPDGLYTWTYQLYVNGVAVGSPVTVSISIGSGVFIGAITFDNTTVTGSFTPGVPSTFSGSIGLSPIAVTGLFSSGSASVFSGAITLDSIEVNGSFSSGSVSQFTGTITLSDITVSGTFSSSGGNTLDPTTPLGRVRLKIGDYSDLPILPDAVINATLADVGNSVNRASQICAQYILGILTSRTHKKLAQLETWSGEQFDNYVKFLQLTVLNPNLTTVAPVPYSGAAEEEHPIQQFVSDWKDGYKQGSIVMPPQTPGRVIEYAF